MSLTRTRLSLAGLVITVALLSGCASVPMASKEKDAEYKSFNIPPDGKAALYVYRNSSFGAALLKKVTLDGEPLGQTASNTYLYKVIAPGSHTLATQSEFSDNTTSFDAVAGRNYFAHQYIKMGLFVGGANVEMVSEDTGKQGVKECQLAAQGQDK